MIRRDDDGGRASGGVSSTIANKMLKRVDQTPNTVREFTDRIISTINEPTTDSRTRTEKKATILYGDPVGYVRFNVFLAHYRLLQTDLSVFWN